MTPLLPVADAQARLLALAQPVAIEEVRLAEAAGRWAADDIIALRTQPDSDLSAMDGYAIRFADLPGPWRLIGESGAGHPFTAPMGTGEAVRIFTGAAMPPGADSVLVQEEAQRHGSSVRLTGEGPSARASSVRPAGLDFHRGDVLIAAGDRITPARLALAAIGGHATLPVRKIVRVAIAATGDELVPPGSALPPGCIPETNGMMLTAQLAGLPVAIDDLGILPDRADALAAAFAAVDADILVTTGGASVGDHDLVRPALVTAGATLDFWRVALRPGKPMLAGTMRNTIVLGLPGNPVSAFVTAELFLKPLIAALAGAATPFASLIRVRLGEAVPANDHRADYLRGELRDGHAYAASLQDSSMLQTLARSTCLILRPPHAPAAAAGEHVDVIVTA